jgi:hypothetical protein
MRRAFRTTLFLVVACVCAGRAWAQTEIDDVRKNSRVHFDDLYVTPTFQVKEFGLDTNVYNANGTTTPDFTATFSPGADLALPIARRALITSHVDSDFVYYAKYASQRSIDPNVTLQGKLFLHRITLFADSNYLNSRQPVNQEIDLRAQRTDKGASGGVDVRIFPKLDVSISAHTGSIRYAADQVFRGVDLEQSLADDLKTGMVAANYHLTPLTTLVLRTEVQEDRFLYSPQKSSDSYSIMPGVEFKPRALISGSAYIGFRQFNPLEAVVPKFSGLVADLSLRYTLRSATAFTVTANRDVQVSYEESEPYYISTSVGLLVRRQLVGSFDMTFGIQRFNYAYQDLVGVNPEVPRVDITYNYSTDVGYRLGRRSRVGVGVVYATRDSNQVEDVGYSRLRVGSTFNYGF